MKTLLMAAIALMIATSAQAETQADFCNRTFDDYAGVVTLEKYCGLSGSAKTRYMRATVDNQCPEPSRQVLLGKFAQQRVEFAEALKANPDLCESQAVKDIIGY